MAIVAYARVSHRSQSLEVQLEQLKAAGAEKVFAEKVSGRSMDGRDELKAAIEWSRAGDIFQITRLDRIARSIGDLRKIVDRLEQKGVALRVLQQAIDTSTSEGRLLLNLLGSFAEFESDLRKERQAEGIAKARLEKGKYRGRPQSISAEAIAALEAEGFGPSEIAKKLKIGRASVYRLRAATTLHDGA